MDSSLGYEHIIPDRRKIIHVVVHPAKFRELPLVYTVYFKVFRDSPLWNIYCVPERKVKTMTTLRTIAIRLVQILLARLKVATQKGSIIPLFQSRWDPVPLEIVANDEIVGCCFLVRLSSKAFELGIIGVLEAKRGVGIGTQAVEAIKEYVRKMGATRIIAGSGPRHTAGFFTKCGFKLAFTEDVLACELNKTNKDNWVRSSPH